MRRKLPNLLTVSRFPLCLLAVALILTDHFLAAASVYFFGELTDYLDGMLARRWNTTTSFGKTADLLADKFTIVVVLGILSTLGIVPVTMFVIVCGREILISTLRQIAGKLGWPNFLKTSKWGRYTSVILREAVGFIVLLMSVKQHSQWWLDGWTLVIVLAWLGVLTRIFFFFYYLWRDRQDGILITRRLLTRAKGGATTKLD